MKKKATIISVLLMTLFFCVPAYADVIFEPSDNFYESHRDECTATYYGARYTPVSENGADIYLSPEKGSEGYTVPSGYSFWSNVTYKKGDETWLYCEGGNMINNTTGDLLTVDGGPNGWVKASEVTRLYDSELFTNDYKDEIIEHNEGECVLNIENLDLIYSYSYPYGPLPRPVELAYIEDKEISFSYSYVDPEGNTWGYLGYWYGGRNAWVCLNHPTYNYEEMMNLNTTSFTIEPVREPEDDTKEPIPVDDESTSSESTSIENNSKEETDISEKPVSEDKNEGKKTGEAELKTVPESLKNENTKDPVLFAGIAVIGLAAVTTLILLLLRKKR